MSGLPAPPPPKTQPTHCREAAPNPPPPPIPAVGRHRAASLPKDGEDARHLPNGPDLVPDDLLADGRPTLGRQNSPGMSHSPAGRSQRRHGAPVRLREENPWLTVRREDSAGAAWGTPRRWHTEQSCAEGRGAARGVGVKLAGLDGTARDGTRMAQPRGHGKGTQRCGTEGLRRPSAMQTRQRERGGGGKHGGELKTNRNQSQRGNKYISSQLRFSTWPKYTSGQDKANRSSDMHRWLSHALRGCIQKSEPWPSGSWRNAGGLRTPGARVKTGRGWTDCPTTVSSSSPLEESGGTGSEN